MPALGVDFFARDSEVVAIELIGQHLVYLMKSFKMKLSWYE